MVFKKQVLKNMCLMKDKMRWIFACKINKNKSTGMKSNLFQLL